MSAAEPTLIRRLVPNSGPLARPLLQETLLVLGGTVLLALCARISFPIPTTPVPITLQTFAVLLIGALYGPRLGALTMLAYLAEGLLGLPVFSFGRSAWTPTQLAGLPLIIGPTAGYLFAMPLAAALVGWFATRGWDRKLVSALPAMLLGNLVILVGGLLWASVLNLVLGQPLNLAGLLMASVLPFLPGDLIKIGLAALALPGGWALLRAR